MLINITNYHEIFNLEINALELKQICKDINNSDRNYKKCKKIKISGTKNILKQNIYCYYHDIKSAITIQRAVRTYLLNTYYRLKGPALNCRNICVNDTDFYTMDPISEISNTQFFSYKDVETKCVYGFDIISITNIILTDNKITNLNAKKDGWKDSLNPYNRDKIPHSIILNLKRIMTLNNIIINNHNNKTDYYPNIKAINFYIEKEILTPQQTFHQQVLVLFQNINALGNYSDPEWFTSLTYGQHITFLKELLDLWYYRAELTDHSKMTICPPTGNPFPYPSTSWFSNPYYFTTDQLVRINMDVIEKLTSSAVLISDRCTGAYYVLAVLTLVSATARNALPWLYLSIY
jgi:hypothetical protein